MRRAWHWLIDHLPERMLRAFDLVPFVVVMRRGVWQSEKNAFDLGREYEAGIREGKIPDESPSW